MARIRRRMRHRRHARRRRPRARHGHSEAFSKYPYKLAIGHDTNFASALIGTQEMATVCTVGAIGKVASDNAVYINATYFALANQDLMIKPNSATYATYANEVATGGPWEHKYYFKSQKARVMFTNTSLSPAFVELYHLYPRQKIDQTATSAGAISTQLTAGSSITNFTAIPNTDTNVCNVTPNVETPGVTPYDVPATTLNFYIKRVGLKRLDPGASAVHILRVGPHLFHPAQYQNAACDHAYLPHYTKTLVVRIWGCMVETTATGALPNLAPVKVLWGVIYRTKFKRISDPIYGQKEFGTDSVTMGAGTVPKMIVTSNPATTGTIAGADAVIV